MDSTSATQTSAGTAAAMGTITTAQLVLMAILAVVSILGIWWGIRLKRRRLAADRKLTADRAAAEAGTPGSTQPAPVAAPAAPPIAPPPPPLADEPIPAAAAMDATPASIAADVAEEPAADVAPAPPMAPVPDSVPASDLSQLKGLGPKLVAKLAELGITRIDQIAALTPGQADELDARLGTFRGRLARDRWIEQARLLSAGDRAGYEAAFGKLG